MGIRVIKGFENYSVDEHGNVFGIRVGRLKVSFCKRGYHRVWLYKNGKRVEKYIHRLVAQEFVPGDNTLTVNHIDGNKNNNHFSNLEWITNAENLRHSFRIGIRDRVNMGKNKGAYYAGDILELKNAINYKIENNKSLRSVSKIFNINRATLTYQYNKNFKNKT